MLICDILSHLPNSEIVLPINAVTSIIGAPIVVYLLLNKSKNLF
jgi:iron complex transport system permease protein